MMISTLDIESSGLSSQSYPIEIGVCLSVNNSCIEKNWLIKPENSWVQDLEWSLQSESKHGISKEYLINNGISAIDVCHDLNKTFDNKTLMVDTSQHDLRWINFLFNYFEIDRSFNIEYIFNDEHIMDIISKVPIELFETKQNILIKEHKIREHRALDDAKLNFLLINHFLNS